MGARAEDCREGELKGISAFKHYAALWFRVFGDLAGLSLLEEVWLVCYIQLLKPNW